MTTHSLDVSSTHTSMELQGKAQTDQKRTSKNDNSEQIFELNIILPDKEPSGRTCKWQQQE